MSIPVHETLITVSRTPASSTHDAGTDAPLVAITIAADVRAVIGSPGGREDVTASAEGQGTVDARLTCDPVDGGLTHRDQVLDQTTGLTYEVVWQARRGGFGLDHEVAGLRRLEGTP